MHFLALSVLVQIACAVHCVRNGRNAMWLTVIIFLSIPGCLAYVLFEVLPQYRGRREVRAVKAAAVRAIDPDRAVRLARDALELADTAANRVALGDALADQEAWREAVSEYRHALARTPLGDRAIQFKLANAELEAGNAAEARELLEALPASNSPTDNDRAGLLLGRALQECGEKERALELFAQVASRMAGGEALCRQAALLLDLGRKSEAAEVLSEVERRAKRLDRFERGRNSEMYDWASRTLAGLRADQALG